jgi:hypothetical protein
MPSYKICFSKNLLSSDGHQFKCVQQTITVDANNPQAAIEAGKRQFERQKHARKWRLYADQAEATENRELPDSRPSSRPAQSDVGCQLVKNEWPIGSA